MMRRLSRHIGGTVFSSVLIALSVIVGLDVLPRLLIKLEQYKETTISQMH